MEGKEEEKIIKKSEEMGGARRDGRDDGEKGKIRREMTEREKRRGRPS